MAGDTEAFRQLVERHSRSIFQVAYRMTANRDDADEVVQETFLRAYRRLGKFESRSSFKTWLYRIAVNCCLDLLESRKVREGSRVFEREGEAPIILQAPSDRPSPERMAMSAQTEQAIRRALDLLTPVERTAFLLRHLEGKSMEEIAQVLQIKVGASKNCVYRAVQKMRKALAPGLHEGSHEVSA